MNNVFAEIAGGDALKGVNHLHLVLEDRCDIAGGVQHTDDLDALFDRPIEDQVVLESPHLPDAKAGEFRPPELLSLAKFRHCC